MIIITIKGASLLFVLAKLFFFEIIFLGGLLRTETSSQQTYPASHGEGEQEAERRSEEEKE